MPQPILTTQHLILRPLRFTDAQDIFAYASDPEVARFTQWPSHATLEDTYNYIASLHVYAQLNQSLLWGIEYTKEQKIIGECGFASIAAQHAELYYALAKNYWGHGFATESLIKLIEFGFTTLRLERIEAWIIAENKASHRVAQKLGMRCETILYNHWYTDDTLYNIYVYTLNQQAPVSPVSSTRSPIITTLNDNSLSQQ